MTMADRICVMSAGRIEQIGTPEEVYYCPNKRIRRALLRRQQRHRRKARPRRSPALPIVETPFGRFRLRRQAQAACRQGDRGHHARPPGGDRASRRPATCRTACGRRSRRWASSVRSRTSMSIRCNGRARPLALMVKLPSRVDGPAVSVGQEMEIGWHSPRRVIWCTA